MDPLITSILTALATNYFTEFTAPVVKDFFEKVFQINPSLESELKAASTNEDFEKIFKAAVGVIDAQAGTGLIKIDNALLEALRGIRFDHQNGLIFVSGSWVNAPKIQIGSGSGTGKTTITNSKLKSQRASIDLNGNSSLNVGGNATVKIN